MGGTELCLQGRGKSLVWLPCLRLYRGGGRDEYDEEEEEEGEGEWKSIHSVEAKSQQPLK